ncbi:MAG TPA: DUF6009 family protein [Candidatus Sericytochromatia bacterium]
MGGMVREKTLMHEKEIIRLKDLNNFPWVREVELDFCQRQGIPKSRKSELEAGETILVGYADLEEDAPPAFTEAGQEYFWRRVFYIDKGDFEAYGDRDCPGEAVEPSSVHPKVKGTSPKRKAQIAVRLPLMLFKKLNAHIQKTGRSQTQVVISALEKYLDTPEEMPLHERVLNLEKRVAALEAKD